jgi:serine/threonine protein kinase
MRQLDHPNIVKLVDFSEAKQYYYIILELCPGGELFHQIVRLTYFSEDLSRHTIIQVAKALQYLHEEAGVVHRSVFDTRLVAVVIADVILQRYQAREPSVLPNPIRTHPEPAAQGP